MTLSGEVSAMLVTLSPLILRSCCCRLKAAAEMVRGPAELKDVFEPALAGRLYKEPETGISDGVVIGVLNGVSVESAGEDRGGLV